MNTYSGKVQANVSASSVREPPQKCAPVQSAFPVIDNHAASMQARDLPALVRNSLQVRQATQLQAKAGRFSRAQLFSGRTVPGSSISSLQEGAATWSRHPTDRSSLPFLGQPADAAVIQCKIYMDEGGRTVRKTYPLGNPDLDRWIYDPIHRHFKNDVEMASFLTKSTTDIGIIEEYKNIWVRLPKELLVLGEGHHLINLMHITKALGTQHYLYESDKRFDTAFGGDHPMFKEDVCKGQEDDSIDHDLEDAAVWSLDAFWKAYDLIITGKYNGLDENGYDFYFLMRTLYGASLMASDRLKASFDEQGFTYKSPQEEEMIHETSVLRNDILALDNAVKDKSQFKVFLQTPSVKNMTIVLRRVIDYLAVALKSLDPETEKFKTDAHDPNKYGKITHDLEERRENYMLTRILEVKDHYRLIGMGEQHRQRLEPQLKQHGITSFYMNKWLDICSSENQTREGKALSEDEIRETPRSEEQLVSTTGQDPSARVLDLAFGGRDEISNDPVDRTDQRQDKTSKVSKFWKWLSCKK